MRQPLLDQFESSGPGAQKIVDYFSERKSRLLNELANTGLSETETAVIRGRLLEIALLNRRMNPTQVETTRTVDAMSGKITVIEDT